MKAFGCLVLVGALTAASPAVAARQIFQYRIDHHTYGDIGTYTNTILRNGNSTDVETEMHVAVRVLGIVMFRQDATRSEHWQGARLVGFHGVTVTDGDRVEVDGQARRDGFAITTANGTVVAPADVHPTNPWSPMVLDSDWMMSTTTGQLFRVRVTGGAETNVTLGGTHYRLRQYEIHADKHEFVWLNDQGTTVAFRTERDGTPIDFILQHEVATQ